MYTFRDFEKSLLILDDPITLHVIGGEHSGDANAILCYGYVDHAAGLTFEALSLLSCVDGDYTIVLDSDELCLKIRADEKKMSQARPIRNKALLARYAERIELLSELYYENAEVVKARGIRELDPLRYPQCPDDISVLFVWQDKELEQLWVRCEKYMYSANGRHFFEGRLLNEPDRDFGFHAGKRVQFALFVEEGQTVCIGSGNVPD